MKPRRSGWPTVVAIGLYRSVGRNRTPGRCLFWTPCSQHIESVAATQGWRAAITAASERWRACRTGYELQIDEDNWWIRCADGSTHSSDVLSTTVHDEAAMRAYLLDQLSRAEGSEDVELRFVTPRRSLDTQS